MYLFDCCYFRPNCNSFGGVKDDTGEPVIGAGVLVKGTTLGTITDIDGHFSFRADDLNGVLVVSFCRHGNSGNPDER